MKNRIVQAEKLDEELQSGRFKRGKRFHTDICTHTCVCGVSYFVRKCEETGSEYMFSITHNAL